MGAGNKATRWGSLAAWSWLLVVAVLDVIIPRDTAILTVMYGFAPLIACAVLSPVATAAIATAAAVFGMVSGAWNHAWGTPQHVFRMTDVVLVGAAAVVISTIRVRREEQVARLVAIADIAQRAILPTLPEQAGPVTIAARYVSAVKDAVVGGDLFDCYCRISDGSTCPERVRFIVGDVRGKGLAGIEQAARTIRAFRQAAALEPTLPRVARDMDRYLRDFFDDEDFVTAILVDVSNPDALVLVSCGHPPALLRNGSDGHVRLLDAPPGLPLGMGLSTAPHRELVVPWDPGDRLLLYTDGLSEARDAAGVFLSPLALEPALQGALLPATIDAILDIVAEHTTTGRLADDLALLLLEHVGTTADSPRGRRTAATSPKPAPRSVCVKDAALSVVTTTMTVGRDGTARRGASAGIPAFISRGDLFEWCAGLRQDPFQVWCPWPDRPRFTFSVLFDPLQSS